MSSNVLTILNQRGEEHLKHSQQRKMVEQEGELFRFILTALHQAKTTKTLRTEIYVSLVQ